jgi:FtsZ-binding cell division protein ZapB
MVMEQFEILETQINKLLKKVTDVSEENKRLRKELDVLQNEEIERLRSENENLLNERRVLRGKIEALLAQIEAKER